MNLLSNNNFLQKVWFQLCFWAVPEALALGGLAAVGQIRVLHNSNENLLWSIGLLGQSGYLMLQRGHWPWHRLRQSRVLVWAGLGLLTSVVYLYVTRPLSHLFWAATAVVFYPSIRPYGLLKLPWVAGCLALISTAWLWSAAAFDFQLWSTHMVLIFMWLLPKEADQAPSDLFRTPSWAQWYEGKAMWPLALGVGLWLIVEGMQTQQTDLMVMAVLAWIVLGLRPYSAPWIKVLLYHLWPWVWVACAQ